jgi:hypothetical protein
MNVTGSRFKVYLCFFNAMVTIVGLLIYLIAIYINKFRTDSGKNKSLLKVLTQTN